MARKPSSEKLGKTMLDAIHKAHMAEREAVEKVIAAVKEAEQAKADAKVQVFAAKAIVQLAKEAGIKGPPEYVKEKVIADARERAEAAREKAEAVREKAQTRVAAAREKAAAARAKAEESVARASA